MIKTAFNSILKNPLTLWMRWLLFKFYYESKFRRLHLKIMYMVHFSNSRFGKYNVLNEKCILADVELGDFTYVAANTKIARTRVGKYCCIGPDVICGLGQHPTKDFVSSHPIFYSPRAQTGITFTSKSYFSEFEAITIGNDVWIGARSIIADGIFIGNGAIVAAGAVVTKNVPAFAIVGGVPAKVLRYRFDALTVECLEEMKWWDWDPEFIKEHVRRFHDIQNFKDWYEINDIGSNLPDKGGLR